MNTKHTLGPWILGGASGRMITTPNGYTGDGFIADVDTLANARLIAAAPDLYEAARFALSVFRSHFQFDSHDFDEVRETLQDAIAKVSAPEVAAQK